MKSATWNYKLYKIMKCHNNEIICILVLPKYMHTFSGLTLYSFCIYPMKLVVKKNSLVLRCIATCLLYDYGLSLRKLKSWIVNISTYLNFSECGHSLVKFFEFICRFSRKLVLFEKTIYVAQCLLLTNIIHAPHMNWIS